MGLSLIRGMIARLPKQGLFLKTRTESSNLKQKELVEEKITVTA
jgi:hypothetical protein